MEEAATQRLVAIWCHDWPVVALGHPPGRPVAVITANRVVATSAAARRHGVTVGLRRREAQSRCPHIDLVARDIDSEARVFDRVVSALESVTPRVEIVRPGAVVFPVRGPGRYFGGEASVLERVDEICRREVPSPEVLVGIGVADGAFAALLAARRARCSEPQVVAVGSTSAFLAPLPVAALAATGLTVTELAMTELADVFVRLGVTSLGSLSQLRLADVLARFGTIGVVAHRLACGLDAHPPAFADPPPDLEASCELEPPAERVDQVAFAAKALADDFCEGLARRGHACARVVIVVETLRGDRVERAWRDELSLTPLAIAQRIRWQLDGWLTATAGRPGSSSQGRAVCRITLRPEVVTAAFGQQQRFWGGRTDASERAVRAAERVETMLGEGTVSQPVVSGGRAPGDQYRLAPLGAVVGTDPTARTRPAKAEVAARVDVTLQWPGQIPRPSPARVWEQVIPAQLVDAEERAVTVSGRGVLSAPPARLSIRGTPWVDITAWAGPWICDERWWDAVAHRRRARFQVVLGDDTAHLVALEDRRWWIEATYD